MAGLREFAAAFVATAGVILGLVAALQKPPFPTTIRIAVGALVAAILIGVVLVGLLLQWRPTRGGSGDAIIAIVFNFALWSLGLGLLAVALAFISS